MNKKAIIDIGSLKVKTCIFDTKKRELLQANSYMTLLGKGISEQHHILPESLDRLEGALEEISHVLKKEKIEDVIIIGTEALRKADNRDVVHALISTYLPGHMLEIIDQHKEAELFFTAVSREFPDQSLAVMDIGGGSVQLIFGSYNSRRQKAQVTKKYNLATGTYRLQQQYSPSNDHISELFSTAEKVVTDAYASIVHTAPILVFGSTCMLDFLQSSQVPMAQDTTTTQHSFYVKERALRTLLQELRRLTPNSRDHYFPSGGYFMYGADYLLLNLLEAAKLVRPLKIYPTNLNSSYGLI